MVIVISTAASPSIPFLGLVVQKTLLEVNLTILLPPDPEAPFNKFLLLNVMCLLYWIFLAKTKDKSIRVFSIKLIAGTINTK